jgi:signal peptidase I
MSTAEDPYAATAALDPPPPEVPSPNRGLAILVSVLAGLFPGAGLLLLGRRGTAAVLIGAGLASQVLFAVLPVGLIVPGLAAGLLLWVVGIVVTCTASPAGPMTRSRAWKVAAALVIGSLAGKLATRVFLVEAFKIPSGSMMPTLLVGDRFFCDKTVHVPGRGDPIVFRYPLDRSSDYISRVIALPGETIAIAQDVVMIDGHPLARRRLDQPCAGGSGLSCELWEEQAGAHIYRTIQEVGRVADFGPQQVQPGHVFVLGDNRDDSNDSRAWGQVPFALIKGRATVIWGSLDPAHGTVRGDRCGRRIE